MLTMIRGRSPEEWLGVLLMTLVLVLLSMQVIGRYVLGWSFAWIEEVSRFAFVWAVYFGFAVAAEKDRHIRVSVQIAFLPPRAQKILLTVADLIWLGFNALVIWFGTIYIADMFEFPMVSQTTGINIAWVQMIVPLGFLLLSFRVIQVMIRRWKNDEGVIDTRMDE
ncbi:MULTISPECIES: TRAP transporter small permease [Cereibacter]|nr:MULTISPECIES: TRAP transporter small permease [Cereibacter]ABN78634.1 Tripartite ATP-independent periplasmic transporter, DctQ component [Cereibacter sphaeroides ATCC 17029]MEA5162630.1 TRAP transporter small permease [Cereibacter johrii]PTM76842.1 TRAP-type C4-dicarboxylate transport system permease small subunit [Cereibacter johrii]SNT22180.1 TRAP-type C4-dicarboxylate transport system, small permease component [[Luteovulum] sphaeroides subsp. megalophilum]